MKKILLTLGLALGSVFASVPAQAITLDITPSQQNALVGDTVSVGISISGLAAASEVVSAFDLNVLFNSLILGSGGSITFNAVPVMGGVSNTLFNSLFDPGNRGADVVSFLADNDLVPLQTADPLLLLTFTFTAIGEGITPLTFGPDLDFDRNVVGRNATSLGLTYGSACVAVGAGFANGCVGPTQVPAPAPLFLLAAGFLGMLASSRLRRIG